LRAAVPQEDLFRTPVIQTGKGTHVAEIAEPLGSLFLPASEIFFREGNARALRAPEKKHGLVS